MCRGSNISIKWQVTVLLEQEDLSYIANASTKIEVTVMYSVETTKNYSCDHRFIELPNALTQNSEFNNVNEVL